MKTATLLITLLGARVLAFAQFDDPAVVYDHSFHREKLRDRAHAIAPLPHGQIFVATLGDGLIRLESNGVKDPSFAGLQGPFFGEATDIRLQGEKILMGGRFRDGPSDYMVKPVIRLNVDGSHDPTYQLAPRGPHEYQYYYFLGFQSDGAALLHAWDTSIVRAGPDGELDSAFATIPTRARPHVLVLPDNSFLASIPTETNGVRHNWLRKFQPGGGVDPTFPEMKVEGQGIAQMVRQPTGTIWLSGTFTRLNEFPATNLARITQSGEVLSSSIPLEGIITTLTPTPDGGMLAQGKLTAGSTNGTMLLLDAEGRHDPNFIFGGEWFYQYAPAPVPIAFTSDGMLLTEYQGAITRFSLQNALLSTVEFTTNVFALREGSDREITLLRRGNTNQEALVQLAFTGSASNNEDFILENTTIRIPAGERIGSAPISIKRDNLAELDEGLSLSLSNLSNASTGLVPNARLRIADANGGPGNLATHSSNRWDMTGGTIRNMIKDASGRVVATGFLRGNDTLDYRLLFRFHADGTRDETFVPPSISRDADPLAFQSDGKIVFGGALRSVDGKWGGLVARVHPSGEFDPSFVAAEVRGHSCDKLAVDSTDRVIAGGLLNYGGILYPVVRFEPDGKVDRTFSSAPYTHQHRADIVAQPDNKIITAFAQGFVGRLKEDGKLDFTFNPIDCVQGADVLIKLLPDGQLLVAMGSGTNSVLVKAASNGIRNLQFEQRVRPNGTITAMLVQSDGKIVVAGVFTELGGHSRSGLARIDQQGNVDPLFNPGVGADGHISSIVELNNGNILLAGSFRTFNLMPAVGLAEIAGAPSLRLSLASAGLDMVQGFIQNKFPSPVQIESSTDLITWRPLTNVLEGDQFSIQKSEPSAKFLRALQSE